MRIIKFIVLTLCVLSCNGGDESTKLVYLGKNAYKHPVWEEMLLQERVKLSDIVLAFRAYESTHELDNMDMKIFNRTIRKCKKRVDHDGYLVSEQGYVTELQRYRMALPDSKKRSRTIKTPSVERYSKTIPNPNNYGAWQNIGPFGDPEVRWSATGNGAIQYLEMHPTNPAIMYACSRNGGLWKTINFGKNWTPETDHFATNNTSCIEVCRANPTIMYLGAAEDQKVWYTSDGGDSWENRSSGLSGVIYDIHSDPKDASRTLVATTNGIFLTEDSGLTWVRKIEGKFTDIDLTDNWDLIVVALDNKLTEPSFYFSNNKAISFKKQLVTAKFPKVNKFYLAIHKPNGGGTTKVKAWAMLNGNKPTGFIGLFESDYVYAPIDDTSHFEFSEVKHPTYDYPNGAVALRSSDNDAGFVEDRDSYGSVNPYSTATWISDFYVSQNDANRLLMFREKFWGSNDGGITWGFKPSYGGSNWADNRFVTTNISKDTVFWCNDGGIWSICENDLFPTKDMLEISGKSLGAYMNSKVVGRNGDICVSEGSQMDVSQMNKGVFMTGGQDIGQIFVRNGRDSHVASADVYRGRIKPSDDSKFITGSLAVNLSGEGEDEYYVYDYIEPDHFDSERLYGFTNKNKTQNKGAVHLVRSPIGVDGWKVNGFRGENRANTGGHSWTPTHNIWEIVDVSNTSIENLHAGSFEQSRANGDIAFLGDGEKQRVFMTSNLSDKKNEWVQLPNAPKSTHYRIASHQYNENIIVVATTNSIFVSKDRGETWSSRGAIPAGRPERILVDKNSSEGIYVMTGLTVYYRDESMTKWCEYNRGLPLQNLNDMRIGYYADGDNRLYVSKYGRGVWSSPLQSVLNANEDRPKADFVVHATSKTVVDCGTEVRLLNQSANATAVRWIVSNGDDVIKVGSVLDPEIVLNSAGFYDVTLVADNEFGSDTIVKRQCFEVSTKPSELATHIEADGSIVWYKRLLHIKVDDNQFTVPSTSNYINSSKMFELVAGDTTNVYIQNSHSSYSLYTKVWIDFNNDGDFDDSNEEIISSEGLSTKFTDSFIVPTDVLVNQQLRMRIVGLESRTAPETNQSTGTRQIVDIKVKVLLPPVKISTSHQLVSCNKAEMVCSYSGAEKCSERGFVYSTFNGELTTENSDYISTHTQLSDSATFNMQVRKLEYNRTYYYRSFVRDLYGIHYGEIKSFKLDSFKIPTMESIIANNIGNGRWVLQGAVTPEGNVLDQISIEWVSDGLENIHSFNADEFSRTEKTNLYTEIDLDENSNCVFRVKAVVEGKVYYSNSYCFETTKSVESPVVNGSPWFRRIRNVTFNGNSNNSSGGSGYEDFTSLVYDVDQGGEYSISVTDSYSPGYNQRYIIYIDYNNDGDFDDYHEVVAQGDPKSDVFNAKIIIPNANVTFDIPLRMRVVCYSGTTTPYHLNGYGEIEDYSIRVNPTVSKTKINNVEFAGRSNKSFGVSGYEDFSNIVFNLETDSAYPIVITDSYLTESFLNYAVFIDYNNDGEFNLTDEKVVSGSPGDDRYSDTVVVPKSGVLLNEVLKMRVIAYDDSFESIPLSSQAELLKRGEIEDYSVRISSKVLIDRETKDVFAKVFPNPVVNNLNIYFQREQLGRVSVNIFDMNSKLMKSEKCAVMNKKAEMNIDVLPAGVYILQLESSIGSKQTLKFVKN